MWYGEKLFCSIWSKLILNSYFWYDLSLQIKNLLEGCFQKKIELSKNRLFSCQKTSFFLENHQKIIFFKKYVCNQLFWYLISWLLPRWVWRPTFTQIWCLWNISEPKMHFLKMLMTFGFHPSMLWVVVMLEGPATSEVQLSSGLLQVPLENFQVVFLLHGAIYLIQCSWTTSSKTSP